MNQYFKLYFTFCQRPHHRCLTVEKKHDKDSGCHSDTRHSCCRESNAQRFIKGKKVQLARDAGNSFSIRPELRRTLLTLK